MVTMIMQKTGNDGNFYLGITRAGEEARDSYISPFFHRQHLAIFNLMIIQKRGLQKIRSLRRSADISYGKQIVRGKRKKIQTYSAWTDRYFFGSPIFGWELMYLEELISCNLRNRMLNQHC